MTETIQVRGAREHNLKNVNLDIPKNKLVVFTGVSGSGKSSMAFDTIYAEGQRRYIESLSSYARQFLGLIGKPNVDFIDGLSPSISIDQKSVSHNPRSTVGTTTEIYDYMRLLFARIGHPYCPNCGIEISKLSIDEITKKIVLQISDKLQTDKIKPHKFRILSPVVRRRRGEFTDLFDNLRQKGYSEVIIDGRRHYLDEDFLLIKTNKHDIDAIVDNISIKYSDIKSEAIASNLRSRVFTAVEQALNLSVGLVILEEENSQMRSLYSEKFACSRCGLSLPEIEPRLFSFNSPLGACEKCRGLGFILRVDEDLILNRKLSIDEGAILPFAKVFCKETWFSRLLKTFLDDTGTSSKLPIDQIAPDKIKSLLWGNNKLYRVTGKNRFGHETSIWETYIGIIPELEKRFYESDSEFTTGEIEKYMVEEDCDLCLGKRLKSQVLSIKIADKNIYDVGELSIDAALTFFDTIEQSLNQYEKQVSSEVLKEIKNRLIFLENVGLTYLTLNRAAKTLSGGESQRIRLASQIGSGLTGVIYVLDEPSIGLHSKDVAGLIASLKKLRSIGNSVIVVEHDPETIYEADYIVDFGPLAGKKGGQVVFAGSPDELKKHPESITAQYLFGRRSVIKKTNVEDRLKKASYIILKGARQFNLKNITVRFPLGMLSCVSGVSGSGKSTLIVETLYKALALLIEAKHYGTIGQYETLSGYQYLDKVYLVDQSPIGKTPRSNPATYVGLFDHIRDLFAQSQDAKLRGYSKGRFSFNVKGGRCEKCGGAGTIKIEMQFLSDVYVKCDVCGGKRYNTETLEVKFKDKNIFDVLNLTIDEAAYFFKSHAAIHHKLAILQEVGLGYLELGQPAPTLSGGEAQRIKLAHELVKKETGRTLYILDEPTTGLHLYDIEKLISSLQKLVDKGNTVIIIEHNLDVIAKCDYIVDLGPEGGEQGGNIIFQGPTAQILKEPKSYTGYYLKRHGKFF